MAATSAKQYKTPLFSSKRFACRFYSRASTSGAHHFHDGSSLTRLRKFGSGKNMAPAKIDPQLEPLAHLHNKETNPDGGGSGSRDRCRYTSKYRGSGKCVDTRNSAKRLVLDRFIVRIRIDDPNVTVCFGRQQREVLGRPWSPSKEDLHRP